MGIETVIDLDGPADDGRQRHRWRVRRAEAVTAAAATVLLIAPEPLPGPPPVVVVVAAFPTGSAAAAIYRTDGSHIDPPWNTPVTVEGPPAGASVIAYANDDAPTAAWCTITIDGRVVEASGPGPVASCQWQAATRGRPAAGPATIQSAPR